MEIRPYVVEQHFGSELVDIEVEIGFMETWLKTNKMKEKRSQTEHLLLVLHIFVKLVVKQTKGKMIVNVIKKSQHSFYELFRSPFTFGMYPQQGCSVHWGMFSTSEFSIEIERILSSCSPTCIMISLRCTHDIPPMYSWYPPNVLMVSPRCTEYPPMYSWYPPTFIMISPDVLNIPRCTHDIPPMY